MKKNYIVDGYNLGFKIPSIAKWISAGNTDRAIQSIKNILFNTLSQKANKIILVFDGKDGYSTGNFGQGKFQVIFSKKPESADDIIRRYIRSQKNASEWIVISSDLEIRNTAKDMGAKAIPSEKFITTIDQSQKDTRFKNNREKYQPENVDIDYWLNKFKQSGDKS